MLLVYHSEGFRHDHEQKQLDAIKDLLKPYYKGDNNAYLIVNCRFGNVEPDALLVSSKYVIGIEFKNYGSSKNESPHQITCVQNGKWFVFTQNGEPVPDEEKNQLYVKGGSHDNPYRQAISNYDEIKHALYIYLGERKRDIEKHLFWFIVFNKNMVANNVEQLHAPWIRVITNGGVINQLNNLGVNDNLFYNEESVKNWLNSDGRGINDFVSGYDYKPLYLVEEEKKPSDNDQKKLESLYKDYYKRTYKGRILFLFIMYATMTMSMMTLWWRNTDSYHNTIGAGVCFILFIWALTVLFTRNVFRRIDIEEKRIEHGIPYVKGLNDFGFFHIIISLFCWLTFSYVLFGVIPAIVENLSTHHSTYINFLNLTSILLSNCGIVIAILTLLSLIYRIYEKVTDADDRNDYISKNCLTMMPFTRLDISMSFQYVLDFFRWIITLVVMSFLVSLTWSLCTDYFDKKKYNGKYPYWPLSYTENVPSISKLKNIIQLTSSKSADESNKKREESGVGASKNSTKNNTPKPVKPITYKDGAAGLTQAEYVTGFHNFMDDLKTCAREYRRLYGLRGEINIEFVIDERGKAVEAKPMYPNSDKELFEAGKEIIEKKMGDWIPAKKDGKNVRQEFSVCIQF